MAKAKARQKSRMKGKRGAITEQELSSKKVSRRATKGLEDGRLEKDAERIRRSAVKGSAGTAARRNARPRPRKSDI
jgi:hypothetical protein